MNEPTEFRAGDTVSWKKTASEVPYLDADGTKIYPKASDGWTLTYYAKNSSGSITIAASADGDDFLVTITAAASAAYTPGVYAWAAFVSRTVNEVAERHQVGSGTFEVLADLAAAGASDTRSHARKVLAALEATIEGRADADVNDYTMNGKSISKMRPEELLTWRDYYRTEVVMEERRERIKKGLGHHGRILMRFK